MQKLKIKENIFIGLGITEVAVRENFCKDLCILFGDIEPTKVGEDLPKEMDETKSYNCITFKNLEGLEVVERALKTIKKELKKRKKSISK